MGKSKIIRTVKRMAQYALLLLICTVVLLLVAAISNKCIPDERSERIKKYDRVSAGMTKAEVNRVLGEGPGCYKTDWYIFSETIIGMYYPDGSGMSLWLYDDCEIGIEFDAAGHVTKKSIDPPLPPTLWDKTQEFLHKW